LNLISNYAKKIIGKNQNKLNFFQKINCDKKTKFHIVGINLTIINEYFGNLKTDKDIKYFNSIKSIQFQFLKDIKIIFINDFSLDNNTQFIIKLQKKDKRLILKKINKIKGIIFKK
jgi:hypothetical protein